MADNQRTILIIDDCLEDRETYRRYLLQDPLYTYTILEEEYGENGLELCKLVKPDAILLDFLLPDIDGLEFLDDLKTHIGRTNLPVIMLTGQGNEAIAVQAMKSGVQDYLVKGNITPQSLRVAIHNVVERAHLLWQLERSEERFRTSVENMLDCFGIYRSIRNESGQIVDFLVEYVNAAACANNRMTQEEQIGKPLLELLPFHREIGLFDDYCQVVETGKPLVKEVLVYGDIYARQYLTKAFDIRIAKLDDGFVAAWRDITERKQAEERLRLLESVVVNANDAVLITAMTLVDELELRILYVNEAFTRMTGYSQEEVLGQSPRLLQGPKTDRLALAQIHAALQARQPVEVELINYRKDGSEFWVEISITPVADDLGECIHFVAIQRDITDRKQTQEALWESQRFIQKIADTTPDLLYIYDLNEQRNIYVNRQIAEVLGYTAKSVREFTRVLLQDLMHPNDIPRLAEHNKKFSSTEDGKILEFEYRLKHINGEWRWFCSRNTVFNRNADGSPHQLLGTAEDITERKRIQEEREQLLVREQAARATAEAANRAKDEFLSMVTHELRNPLAAILGYTQLLRTPKLKQVTFARAIDTMERSAKLQARLIDDLLDISRITSGKLRLNMHPVNLVFVIEAAIDSVRLAAQNKAIEIESVLDYTAGSVLGDANRLQQVVLNLLSNAIKFTPEKGHIQVQLEYIDDYAQVTVSDTGCGIGAEFLPYVFDRFRQADSTGRQGGLGLGLAIVRNLVELHSGTVQVESPGEGQGATFTIKLPLIAHHRQAEDIANSVLLLPTNGCEVPTVQ